MAKAKKPIYCWDTTTLLAWLKEEDCAPIGDMELVVIEIDHGRANLVIPAPVYSEVFMASLTDEQRNLLEALLQRTNVLSVDMTIPIAKRAGVIRERGHAETPKRKLKTIDAQIAATALSYRANVLHSLDDDLLSLNGHRTVDGLSIKKPGLLSGQMSIG